MSDEDHESDDIYQTPDKEPKSSRAWLAIIADAEKVFKNYQDKSDNIDKMYANLERLANTARDRQMQMFWANIAVLGPSIYSRPPVPVVVPRFRDRRPLLRTTSELLERSALVGFEMECIDQIMRQVRDDLTVLARGCAWVRYEKKSKDSPERVCIDYKARKHFLHDPAATWKEVDWVAAESFLTKKEMRKRFKRYSADAYLTASYEVRKDDNGDGDNRKKASVWEVWCKSENRVVWVSEGCAKLLDDDKPHLNLEGFFPCPKPAYATVQRGSLIPVPDMVFYKDQLEEINELTARVGALQDAVKLRGFYPAGQGEVGDAIEAAVKQVSDNMVLIPISNWSLMGGNAKDMIIWLPLKEVVDAIKVLLEIRQQLISDVYEITGLSDIMRGSTDANETLGAQQLKSQYGSIRVRDRQDELIRFARDLTRLMAEIMAENFDSETLLDMSQMEIQTNADIAKQIKPLKEQIAQIERQLKDAQKDPEIAAMAQQKPEQAQQIMQQAAQQIQAMQGQIAELEDIPTVEKIMKLLRDQKTRPFALDIETDSTIAPDENAQKQRATEFITAVGGFMGQAFPLVQAVPQASTLAADMLKYVAGQFRAGRELEGTIDEFADKMKEAASQPQPNPEADRANAEQQAMQAKLQMDQASQQADQQAKAQDAQLKQEQAMADAQLKQQTAMAEAQLRQQVEQANQAREDQRLQADLAAKDAEAQRKVQLMGADDARNAELHQQKLELNALAIEKLRLEIGRVQVQTDATLATTEASIEATAAKTASGIEAQQAKTQFNGEARP